VREIGWIIDSIERMLSKNPLNVSRIFNNKPTSSVYARVENLMDADNGLIGKPWRNLREAWYGEASGRLIVIPYDHLVHDPDSVVRSLYEELGEPLFEHDFDNVIYDEPVYDSLLGMPGLHAVRPKVVQEQRPICIPPELFEKYAHINFWKKPEANHRNVMIL
jgi:sulfotransferase